MGCGWAKTSRSGLAKGTVGVGVWIGPVERRILAPGQPHAKGYAPEQCAAEPLLLDGVSAVGLGPWEGVEALRALPSVSVKRARLSREKPPGHFDALTTAAAQRQWALFVRDTRSPDFPQVRASSSPCMLERASAIGAAFTPSDLDHRRPRMSTSESC